MRLTDFYGALSPSLDSILTVLRAAGLDTEHVTAKDLYQRDLDCHNLGMHAMLGVLAEAVAQHSAPTHNDTVLDIGCGLGGPGRFMVDRFGCAVVGIDLLPLRTERAQALSDLTGMGDRTSYQVADATHMVFDDRVFSQAWMLDVSIHIRAKQSLFAEIARVLRPGGLLVMHDQTGPLPAAMRPLKRQAPYIAPSLPQLVRLVEGAGLRVLTWRDTTGRVLEYFVGLNARLTEASREVSTALGPSGRDRGAALLAAYIETLGNPGGRTGILIASRPGPNTLPRDSQDQGTSEMSISPAMANGISLGS
jgi:ubiquinone/menaquinone biosynthesis C-methylase UbiE